MKAKKILKKAANIVGGARHDQHGDKQQNFRNIAGLWQTYLDMLPDARDLTGTDVAQMMVLLKVARSCTGAYNEDDYLDACGYAGVAGELAARMDDRTVDSAFGVIFGEEPDKEYQKTDYEYPEPPDDE